MNLPLVVEAGIGLPQSGARVIQRFGMVYHPFPSLVVRTSFGMPTPEHDFVCSNDFKRAYPVKLLIILAARWLR